MEDGLGLSNRRHGIMEEIENGKRTERPPSTLEWVGRVVLCFAVVACVGTLGVIHYKTVKDRARRERYEPMSSGGYVEAVSPERYPSRSVLVIGGTECEVTREYVAEDFDDAKASYGARKTSLGWRRTEDAGSAVPLSALSLAAPKAAAANIEYYLTPSGKVVGVAFSKRGSGTKIVSVELDPISLAKRGSVPPGGSSVVPEKYLALMPNPPTLSYRSANGVDYGLYVCRTGLGTPENALMELVEKRLKANGWSLELPTEVVGKSPLLAGKKSGTMVVARKNGVSCNVMISTQEDGGVAAYRFSELKRADARR